MPSRGRPESLRRSVESLREFAASPSGVEVLVGYDPDDLGTAHAASVADVVPIGAPERWGYGQLFRYYNLLAEVANGDWLLLWNDDAFMTVHGWDAMVEALPENILVADLANAFSPGLCCFPTVRRLAVEALGRFTLDTPHVDSVWQEIGRRTGSIHFVDAFVRHERVDLTGGHNDDTYREGRAGLNHTHFFSPAFQAEIDAAAEKVRAACL